MEVINVTYDGHQVGALSFDTNKGIGAFEYAPDFVAKGIELSPIKMPLSTRIYSFPELDFNTFGDPLGYGAMEVVYHLMAKKCGVDMMPCQLLQEGNRRHFITQHFDRINNKKYTY
jgi:hypothetical protein